MRVLLLLALLLCFGCGAPMTGSDAGQDAGVVDAGGVDAGRDAGHDAGLPDAGFDAGVVTRELTQFWGNTQWPPYVTLAVGGRATVYGQVYVEGETNPAGAMPGLEAQLGVGALGSAPETWAWTAATFNVEAGNNDEFKADLAPTSGGLFHYGFRYRVRGATWAGHGEWLYAGLGGPGLTAATAGVLAVKSTGATLKVATQNLACLRDDVGARLDALATRWAALQVDLVMLQEVCDEAPLGNTAAVLAQAMTTRTGRTWRHLFLQTHLANNTTPEGLGIITALPVVGMDSAVLPTQEFPRKALLAMVASPVGVVAAISTHFSFRAEDAAFRVQQAQAVLALGTSWQTGSTRPEGSALFVAGDFNAIPGSGVPEVFTSATPALTDAWASTHPGQPGFSYPSGGATVRIDYLLTRGLTVASASHEFTTPYTGTSYVSDHAGFAAELR